jgi:NTE family protein
MSRDARRALVLGGGGPVGIGWESGLAVGLAASGVDLSAADAIFGTSAGAFVGAHLALGLDLSLIAPALAESRRQTVAATESQSSLEERMHALMSAITTGAVSGKPEAELRRELGRLALEAEVVSEEEFLRFFDSLEGQEWPETFASTAVEATTGEFVVWRAGGPADLRRGVGSSCAVPCVFPPVTIDGRRYLDGGMRTALNADLAAGFDRVVVISVMAMSLPPGMSSSPVFDALMGRVFEELDSLRGSGAEVEVIEPSRTLLQISGWGTALMDLEKAADAYEAGIVHAGRQAERIAALWNRP